MKKLLGILVLGLLWCNTGLAEILELKCSQDYERLPGESEFEKYWLPKDKLFYKFDLEKRRLIESADDKNFYSPCTVTADGRWFDRAGMPIDKPKNLIIRKEQEDD